MEPTAQKAKLSRRQRDILTFIRTYIQERGFPPSIRNIGAAVDLHSSSTVHSHLRTLEAKGYLRRDPAKPRSIQLLDDPPGPSVAALQDLLARAVPWVRRKAEAVDELGSADAARWLEAVKAAGVPC